MLKVEVILGIVASSLAILAFFVRAVVNVRRGSRAARERRDAQRQESPARREISGQ